MLWFKKSSAREKGLFKLTMFICSLTSIAALFLIAFFVLIEGFPVLTKVGLWSFLSQGKWRPSLGQFGVFPMIVGTIYVTLGALMLSVPLALACAIFLAEFAPLWVERILSPAINLLAGIPSVIYGLFGIIVIIPRIQTYLGGPGLSILAAVIVLAIMILPTITNITLNALKAVPQKYRWGSLALGATKWQTIFRISLPWSWTGFLVAVILAMGRAIGETMAVLMVIGNIALVPRSMLDPARTLTSNIALEMGYASGDHRQALFATGIVLFAMVIFLTSTANIVTSRSVNK